jgi:hypothetical protein
VQSFYSGGGVFKQFTVQSHLPECQTQAQSDVGVEADILKIFHDTFPWFTNEGHGATSYDFVAKLRPYLTQRPVDLEWQLIETAPKDGIRYLGMIVRDRFYGEPFVCYYDEDEGHICLHQTEAKLHRPTHWVHFPKPTIAAQTPYIEKGGR